MKVALYLGRFQPFHLGHLSVIEKISKEYDEIVIAIGSAQHCNTKRNPFSYVERWFMIEDTLKDKGISNYRIIPIPDINHPEKWVEFTHAIFGDYDVVITNNHATRVLFEKRGDKVEGVELKNVMLDVSDKGETEFFSMVPICGTIIRDFISGGDDNWKLCVPLAVVKFLTSYNNHKHDYLTYRIKEIYKGDKEI